jgi:hypothetical protein
LKQEDLVISWPDIEIDLRRVLEHPGFVELSHHAEACNPWAVAIRLCVGSEGEGVAFRGVTWFCATSLSGVLTKAVCALERLGPIREVDGI